MKVLSAAALRLTDACRYAEASAFHMPLPLRTKLAWCSGDPVTVNFLMTSFLRGQKPIYQFPSVLGSQ